jgi:hypothetical protein
VERGAEDRLVRCKVGEHNIRITKKECGMFTQGRLVVCDAPADGKMLKERTIVTALDSECSARKGRVVEGRPKQTILTSRGVTMGVQKNEPVKDGGTTANHSPPSSQTTTNPKASNPKTQ